MKKNLYLFFIFIFLLYLLFSGCEKPSSRSGQKSPGETLKAFYMSGNKGKYPEAEQYFSSDISKLLNSQPAGSKAVIEKSTRKGTIEKIEILSEEITDDESVVHYILHFRDGAREDGNKKLVKENDIWKLTSW